MPRARSADKEGAAHVLLAERELQLYREIFQASNDAIAIVDPGGRYLEQNPAHRDLVGYSDEELHGRTPAIHLGEETFRDIVRELQCNGRFEGEVLSRTASGQSVDVDLSAFSLFDDRGRVLCHVGIKRDITERKAHEAELRQRISQLEALYGLSVSLARARSLEAILEASLDTLEQALGTDRSAILLFDAAGVMRYKAWRGVSDAHRAEVEGHSPWGPGSPDPQPVNVADVQRDPTLRSFHALFERERISSLVFLPLKAFGRLIGKFTLYSSDPRRFAKEEIRFAETVATTLAFFIERQRSEDGRERLLKSEQVARGDAERALEERVRAEEDLRRLNMELEDRVRQRTQEIENANKELESFNYSVSHDLRTPLRAIRGFSSLLLQEQPDGLDARSVAHLRQIHEATGRMGQIIEALLQLSRVTRHEIRRQRVDASRLAREILGQLQARDPLRNVSTHVEDGIEVHADAQLLRLCLENLLGNAWKFTSRRPTARIEFGREQREGAEQFFVRDDGAGFDMRDAGHLFRPFHRLHKASEFEGTGIGLATVHRIVARHHGRIFAEAEPCRGATFYFRL